MAVDAVPPHAATDAANTSAFLRVTGAGQSVCVFGLGLRMYALDTAVVGEVIIVDSLMPVPRAPAAVLGLCSLRGTPVALLDTSAVLNLGESRGRPRDQGQVALVVRTSHIVGALWVDRVEAILSWSSLKLMPRSQTHEHDAVAGLVTQIDTASPSSAITLLSHLSLLTRLQQLRLR